MVTATDDRSVTEAIRSREGLVRSTAHRIGFLTGLRDEDMFRGVGRTAIWEALRSFDPERGALESHVRARVWFDVFDYARWALTGRVRGSSRSPYPFNRAPLEAALDIPDPAAESDGGLLLRAMRRVLSDREFRAMVDGYVHRLPASDTAAALGCTPQAVRDARPRALRTLRLLLADPTM